MLRQPSGLRTCAMINFLKMAAMMNQVRTPLFLLVDYLFLPASAAGAEPQKETQGQPRL